MVTDELLDEMEFFPEEELANHHCDMMENEPVMNEARKAFMRWGFRGRERALVTGGGADSPLPVCRQMSVLSADGENPRRRSVRRHGCSQRKRGEPPEKKKELEKLIQAETAETGRVSADAQRGSAPSFSSG